MGVRLMIIDDNAKFRESLSRSLQIRGYSCLTVPSSKDAFLHLSQENFQVILLDLRLGDENGVEVAKRIIAIYPQIPIIMITGFATIESAVEVIKTGVIDYIQKPVDLKKLTRTIENVLTVSKNSIQSVNPPSPSDCFWATKSPTMLHCLQLAMRLATSEIPILIQGESGTGKEVIAEYIHQNSSRNRQPLQKANCAAFTETLLDNELFGHKKGSYTGAIETYKGVFERSDKGSLFLDEIGDMPMPLQSKILRVLQNQEIQPIGSEKTIKIDVRFLSATNKNISQMVEEGSFRKDLYYRLNTGIIELPSLRERKEDILPLLEYFIDRYSPQKKKHLSPQMEGLFMNYPWPGNIRELMNVIQYACLVSTGDEIGEDDLPSSFINNLEKRDIVIHDQTLQAGEMMIIKNTLDKVNNNKKEAAERLNISRSTLYMKIKKYSLDGKQDG